MWSDFLLPSVWCSQHRFKVATKMWSLCISLLILGFTSGVYMETCPEKENIYPCVCSESTDADSTDIQVTCTDESGDSLNLETLKQSLSGLSGKNSVYLILLDIDFGKLPSDYFKGIGIRKLDFDYGSLDSLTNDDQPGLLGLEDYLEELQFIGSIAKTTEPLKLNLGHLKKLKKLVLIYNTITELGDDWLSNAPSSLEQLSIVDNGIKKIGSNVFAELNNLWLLSLRGNTFGPVKRSMFPTTADKLEVLDLEQNELTDLPEDIFTRMPSISGVALKENKFTTLKESTWASIWQQLGYVQLEGNDMYCDDKLNWMLKSEKRPKLFGTCKHPAEVEGDYLEDYLEKQSQ